MHDTIFQCHEPFYRIATNVPNRKLKHSVRNYTFVRAGLTLSEE